MLKDDKVKELFADAEFLYQEAIKELERGKVRDAAEKAWGATVRATDALILARTGKEPERPDITRVRMRELAKDDEEVRERIVPRFYTRMTELHGDCFYLGICEPIEEVERRIKETIDFIEDAKRLSEIGYGDIEGL